MRGSERLGGPARLGGLAAPFTQKQGVARAASIWSRRQQARGSGLERSGRGATRAPRSHRAGPLRRVRAHISGPMIVAFPGIRRLERATGGWFVTGTLAEAAT